MNSSVLVTDTHPLVWYLTGTFNRLSKKVKLAFDLAVKGDIAIWVPVVVLWEVSLLIKKGKLQLTVTLEELMSAGFYARAVHVLELVPEDVICSHQLSFSPDPWDKMIVATAIRMRCPLITCDAKIHDCEPCQLYWD